MNKRYMSCGWGDLQTQLASRLNRQAIPHSSMGSGIWGQVDGDGFGDGTGTGRVGNGTGELDTRHVIYYYEPKTLFAVDFYQFFILNFSEREDE